MIRFRRHWTQIYRSAGHQSNVCMDYTCSFTYLGTLVDCLQNVNLKSISTMVSMVVFEILGQSRIV